jgi:hypothetical protein
VQIGGKIILRFKSHEEHEDEYALEWDPQHKAVWLLKRDGEKAETIAGAPTEGVREFVHAGAGLEIALEMLKGMEERGQLEKLPLPEESGDEKRWH